MDGSCSAGGAPPPVPAPAPPPGTWEIIGTGCEMSGHCVQSKNHPSNYGNGESCSLEFIGSIPLDFVAFDTEAHLCDVFTIGGSQYYGNATYGTGWPSDGSFTDNMTWSSDGSVTKS